MDNNDKLKGELAAERAILCGVLKRGACWYQQSMADGTRLGDPVLVIVTGTEVTVALEGMCIDEEGLTLYINIYADGVQDRPVTPTEVEERIKRAVLYEEQRLRAMCQRLLPRVIIQPAKVRKVGAA